MKREVYFPWLMVVLCCGMVGASMGVFNNAAGVFYTPAAESLGVGRGAFATQATLTMLISGFFTPVVGVLLRKWPLRLLLGVGLAISSVSTVLMAAAQELWQFYLLGAMRGVGTAMFSLLPASQVIGNWFQRRSGLAMGLAMSFSGVSGAVCNPILTQCIGAMGWRGAYLISALLAVVLAMPGVLFLRISPQEVGLLPYGASQEEPPQAVSHASEKTRTRSLVCSSVFAVMAVLVTILSGTTSMGQHFPGFADSVGLGAEVGAVMVSAGMIGNIVSKLLLGSLSDKIGSFYSCSIMIGISLLALLCLSFLPIQVPVLAWVAAFFFGAVYSISGVGFSLMTRQVFGMERYASAYSILAVLMNVGAAVAMTLIGSVYDICGSYFPALLGAMLLQVASLALIALTAVLTKRQKSGR